MSSIKEMDCTNSSERTIKLTKFRFDCMKILIHKPDYINIIGVFVIVAFITAFFFLLYLSVKKRSMVTSNSS